MTPKEIQLKGGFTALDRRLGRLPEFDPLSLNFPIRTVVGDRVLRPFTWSCGTILDQLKEGSCVGHGLAHDLIARPAVVPGVTHATAVKIYREAQKIDQWPGETYEGTSVLAGAKVVQEMGYIGAYRWAFSLNDLLLAVGYAGPVALGVNWYTGMFETDADGWIRVGGDLAGGHCILCNGVQFTWLNKKSPKLLANVDKAKSYLTLANSWGSGWGQKGFCKLSLLDMERLQKEQGEVCVPMGRKARV